MSDKKDKGPKEIELYRQQEVTITTSLFTVKAEVIDVTSYQFGHFIVLEIKEPCTTKKV